MVRSRRTAAAVLGVAALCLAGCDEPAAETDVGLGVNAGDGADLYDFRITEASLVLLPDQTLAEAYGYRPDYVPNVPTFDSENRPYIRSRTRNIHETAFVHTLRNGEWVRRDFLSAIRESYPNFESTRSAGGTTETRVIFDSEDRAYSVLAIALANGQTRTVMIYSTDRGENWSVVELPPRSVAAEHRAGHNRLDGPPFLMLWERIAAHDDRWATQNRLLVTQPRWEDNEIVIPEPVEVSDRLISLGQHSGGAPFAVSRDGKTHFAWIEIAEDDDAPGTPTFAATYDRETGTVSGKVFLAYAPPRNNSHNRPGIVMDSEGHLHVVTGSHHGENFYHTRSNRPNDTQSGWSEPVAVWDRGWIALTGREQGGQTYVSLVCDFEDTLHLVFRHWQKGIENFPHLAPQGRDQFATLSYQRKPKGGEWSVPRTLVIPQRNVYSIFYQKLAIDHRDRLFLAGSYSDRELVERDENERFHNNFILTSADGGDTWGLAETEDFEENPRNR